MSTDGGGSPVTGTATGVPFTALPPAAGPGSVLSCAHRTDRPPARLDAFPAQAATAGGGTARHAALIEALRGAGCSPHSAVALPGQSPVLRRIAWATCTTR